MKKVISFTVYGNPVTKKNHSQIIRRGGRHILIPSKPYNQYSKVFNQYCIINKVNNLILNDSYNLECKYFMQTKRRVDLTNLLAATCDLLTSCGVISDDNSNIITTMNGSQVFYDKANPRVEITITKI